jgi:hypothetical protein
MGSGGKGQPRRAFQCGFAAVDAGAPDRGEQQLNMRSYRNWHCSRPAANRCDLNQAQTDLSKAQGFMTCSGHCRKGLRRRQDVHDTKDDLAYQKQRLAILKRSIAEDEVLQPTNWASSALRRHP